MSDSEENDDYSFYGTPLELFDEDNVPKKKPISIEDQIATDKHGRRRFHGAFTGGFSAGFYNTVGSLEGWKPSSFKSSRDRKAEIFNQKPEDFMDDEDTDEFGIAPTVLRAKPEYSGKKSSLKRERPQTSEGPIPGIPVLNNILESVKETIGVKLLTKMGWKPGQGIGPKLNWTQKMGALDELNPLELGLNPDVLFPPDPVEEVFVTPKIDRFGMGYSGLSREPVLQQRFTLFEGPSLKMAENKKKLSIRGQAFGVGAFEDEDDDIYAKDDISRYDSFLETSSSLREERKKKEKQEKEKKVLASNGKECIEGFLPAKNPCPRRKYFPPPPIPPDFDPNKCGVRKTRFEPGGKNASTLELTTTKNKYILNAEDRAVILGEKSFTKGKDDKTEEEEQLLKDTDKEVELKKHDESFRPFLSNPAKQARYEKYLSFVRIGGKDALKSIQPNTMSDWEKDREASEFDQAARLYQPLSGFMSERFSRAKFSDDDQDRHLSKEEESPMMKAAREEKFGKLTRTQEDWVPTSLLCKRMNIPEPGQDTLQNVAKEANKRKRFSVFDFLDSDKRNTLISNELRNDEVQKPSNTELDEEQLKGNHKLTDSIQGEPGVKLVLPIPSKYINMLEFEDPKEKKDLFKAIFCSSDEENEEDDKTTQIEDKEKTSTVLGGLNPLRNTSPPRGIFANLDLEAMSSHISQKSNKNIPTQEIRAQQEINKEESNENLMYGPSLPTKPVFIHSKKIFNSDKKLHMKETSLNSKDGSSISSSNSGSEEEEWIEKDTSDHKNKRDKKRQKKHKNKHNKKEKQKKKKKKR